MCFYLIWLNSDKDTEDIQYELTRLALEIYNPLSVHVNGCVCIVSMRLGFGIYCFSTSVTAPIRTGFVLTVFTDLFNPPLNQRFSRDGSQRSFQRSLPLD